jgi:hypothetical protein
MENLGPIEHAILAKGRVDSADLGALRAAVYADGKVGRRAADALVALHKRVQHPNPAFEQFFYEAIKRHVLADGRIGAEESAWLRQLVRGGGGITDEERKFLHELQGDARHASPEFVALFGECMEQGPEQRTSG